MSGYEQGDLIREGRHTVVSHGRRSQDGKPIVIKQLRGLYPDDKALDRFQREFDLTRLAAGDKVVEVLDLQQDRGAVQLIVEDIGGRSLADQYAERRPSLATVLEIAVDLADALTTVHDSHIIHKDVNPANVVRNPRTGQLKLIDFL